MNFGCGTVKNFNSEILEAQRLNKPQKWYYLTPIKVKDDGSGYKEVTVNMAYPIPAILADASSEKIAFDRIKNDAQFLQGELIDFMKKYFNVPSHTFSTIPFWANEKTQERDGRRNFGNNSVHIIYGNLTLKYRESRFDCNLVEQNNTEN